MLPPIEFINNKSIPSYGMVRLQITITNSYNISKSYNLEFIVIKMIGFDVILGKPWLYYEELIITSFKRHI
jgi:hypothetical protein